VFISRDPLDGEDGQPDVANPYTYVHNDPTNMVDPEGLRASDAEFRTNPRGPVPLQSSGGAECNYLTCHPSAEKWRAFKGQLPYWFAVTGALEGMGRLMADEAFKAAASPSPRADSEGWRIAQEDVLANPDTEIWYCGERSFLWFTTGSRITTGRYGMPVMCVAPSSFVLNYPGNPDAATKGHFIFCARTSDCDEADDKTIIHEMVHVGQYEEYGDTFTRLYNREFSAVEQFRPGHGSGCHNKYEAAAYAKADQFCPDL